MKTKLIMTLLVRDEEDIIEDNICFHLSSGVDFIVAIDNGSKDKTPHILEKYQKKRALSFSVINEHTFEQSKWVSQMAKEAVEKYKATHLFHCDADEFWFGSDGNLKHLLPKENEVFYIPVINYLPPQDCYSHTLNFRRFHYIVSQPYDYPLELAKQESSKLLLYKYPPKVMTPKNFTEIVTGNHDVATDKPCERTTQNSVFIHHFPIRSYKQFERKVVQGGSAHKKNPTQDPTTVWHWKAWYKLYKDGKLREEYDKLSLKRQLDDFLKKGVVKAVKVPRRIKWAKMIYKVKNLYLFNLS